jgi:methionyl-tRNA formyltransferase
MNNARPWKTVFFGTPDFAVPTLELLHHHPQIELISVVAQPSRPAGRGLEVKDPPVIAYAKEHKLPFFQTPKLHEETTFFEQLKEQQVDLFIVLAFAQFFKTPWLKLPTLGCFNIHTSLLPQFRGAAPIQYAVLHGLKDTGVSIQHMVLKMDAGDVVIQKPMPIYPEETTPSLSTRLKFLAPLALSEFLYQLSNKSLQHTVQDESAVTLAPVITKEMGLVFFDEETFDSLDRKLRAFTPWPGLYFLSSGKRIKILKLEKVHHPLKILPTGTIDVISSTLQVGLLHKEQARLSFLQQEGKKSCSDQEFLRGLRDKMVLDPR